MRRPLAALILLAAAAVLAAACGGDGDDSRGTVPPQAVAARPAGPPPSVSGPKLAAAGDIACRPGRPRTFSSCRQRDTAALIERLRPDVVAPLGDLQYEHGTSAEFRGSYALSWGRLRARTRPAVGNHEYGSRGAGPYFSYFGARAGPRGRGWYSYELGTWHVVVLNSNCSVVGCRRGSAQERWLRADLARHSSAPCTLAYMHHPRFSSGLHGNQLSVAPLWNALEEAGADVVLAGHDHTYERFAPQTRAGRASSQGMVQFVVGTGGRNHYPILSVRRNSRAYSTRTFGVLELTLGKGRYAWRFVGVPGSRFRDYGAAACR